MRRTYSTWFLYSTILILLSGFTKYTIPADRGLVENAQILAESQVGILEIEENSSPEINKYLKSIGLDQGLSYCAAGIYWSFAEANKKLNGRIPLPKTGVANAVFNYFKKNGRKAKASPKKYDLLVWRKPNSWRGHIEWINKVSKAGWVETIAFNSSKNGKEGVLYQRRNIYHPLGRLKSRGLIGFDFN